MLHCLHAVFPYTQSIVQDSRRILALAEFVQVVYVERAPRAVERVPNPAGHPSVRDRDRPLVSSEVGPGIDCRRVCEAPV